MSRLVINFSINVGVTETLSSFRLILGGKADKETINVDYLWSHGSISTVLPRFCKKDY